MCAVALDAKGDAFPTLERGLSAAMATV